MQQLIAGVDEAGRGPLAGPVIAAAVILDEARPIEGLADSKKLTKKQRERLSVIIQERALAYGFGVSTVHEIDQENILRASLRAMQRAVANLSINPDLILVDGNICPPLMRPGRAVVRGDQTEPSISAASILAKVLRDQVMYHTDSLYPKYGFAQHKGYPTKAHLLALQTWGACAIHRQSFRPVQRMRELYLAKQAAAEVEVSE